MIQIKLSSKRVEYNFTLEHKITVVKGHSGVGKTQFTKSLIQNASGRSLKLRLSDDRYSMSVIVDQNNWYRDISAIQKLGSGTKVVFVIDDMDCVIKKEFSDLIKSDKGNYFLIINRFDSFSIESLAGLSVSVDAVYDLKTNGRNHWLEKCLKIESGVVRNFDYVITEDSKSGLEFFRAYNQHVMTSNGKSGVYNLIIDHIRELKGKTVLLFADLAAFGAYMSKVVSACLEYNINLIIPSTYMSFEWLLLYSKFYNYDFSSIDDMFRLGFISDEKMYEKILRDISRGKPYSVKDKDSSLHCYIKDCCCMRKACDRGLSGDKLNALFEGTDYEDLFKRLRTSSLTMLKKVG